MPKVYEVQFEVDGPAAMFARPDTGGTPTSYPVPTWSAAKGLFESIAFFADGAAWICPTKVDVCRRIGDPGGRVTFQRYTTNYGGPLRKRALFNKGTASGGSSMQLFATILSGVCFRLHGSIVGPPWKGRINPRHHLQDLFDRRLKRGQCFRTPCLGWSEFTCSYWGPFRDGMTEVDTDLAFEIPSMLLGMWDTPSRGVYEPKFCQDVKIVDGVLKYEIPAEWLSEQNKEVMGNAQ
ncbi:MAG: CRISPR-associated protein Cas5 [Deltaproteobacteria bacterium]|nr:CRISPR-associated protein Cas5 [Deltaproteobacteria bacterium]